MTFEDYLKERHAEMNPMLLDDDMPDHFDDWLGAIEIDTIIGWGELYGAQQFIEGKKNSLTAKSTEV